MREHTWIKNKIYKERSTKEERKEVRKNKRTDERKKIKIKKEQKVAVPATSINFSKEQTSRYGVVEVQLEIGNKEAIQLNKIRSWACLKKFVWNSLILDCCIFWPVFGCCALQILVAIKVFSNFCAEKLKKSKKR